MPTVSVVIPAYNAERFLEATLDSVRAQILTDWEAVVVDDGSSDGTGALAARAAAADARIRVVRQANAGLPAARNSGLTACDAASPEVVFLDADDVWERDALAVLHEALARAPEAACAYGLARYVSETGEDVRHGALDLLARRWVARGGARVRLREDEPTTFALFAVMNWIATPGVALLRRSRLPPAPFETTLTACEDWDLWLRLSRQAPFAFVPRIVLGYRRHAEQMSADHGRLERNARRVRERAIASPDNTPEQARAARDGYRTLQRFRAEEALRAGWKRLRRASVRRAGKSFARAGLHAARWLRGRP